MQGLQVDLADVAEHRFSSYRFQERTRGAIILAAMALVVVTVMRFAGCEFETGKPTPDPPPACGHKWE